MVTQFVMLVVTGAALVCGPWEFPILGWGGGPWGLVDSTTCNPALPGIPWLWVFGLSLGLRHATPAQQTLASTSEAAYGVNRDGVVIAWNDAAARLFGYVAEEVMGRKCWELLAGRDVFSNRYCCSGCPVREDAFIHASVRDSRLVLLSAAGQSLEVDLCMLLVADGSGGNMLVHLCRPVPAKAEGSSPAGISQPPACLNRQRGKLTSREVELLVLLARGDDTGEIASMLCLSKATVRNHVQHILFKLRVHNRLAAVNKARQLGLI